MIEQILNQIDKKDTILILIVFINQNAMKDIYKLFKFQMVVYDQLNVYVIDYLAEDFIFKFLTLFLLKFYDEIYFKKILFVILYLIISFYINYFTNLISFELINLFYNESFFEKDISYVNNTIFIKN